MNKKIKPTSTVKTTKSNSTKSITSKINARKFIIVLLMPILFFLLIDTADAQRRRSNRSYNPAKTRADAIAILKTSESVSALAGIEPRGTRESSAYSTVNTNSNNNSPTNQNSTVVTGLTEPPNLSEMSDVELLNYLLSEEEDWEDDEEYDGELEGDIGEDIAELEAEDDIQVNVDDFRAIWALAFGADESLYTSFGTSKEALMGVIMEWLGTPYRFAGTTRKAIDCSAWTRAVFFQTDSIVIPRTAREQVHLGKRVSRDKLEFGDLVFFHTYSRRFASHVGIYLGDNLFAHASSRAGVTVSSLNSAYYAKRFIGGRRFTETDYASYKTKTKTNNISLSF